MYEKKGIESEECSCLKSSGRLKICWRTEYCENEYIV